MPIAVITGYRDISLLRVGEVERELFAALGDDEENLNLPFYPFFDHKPVAFIWVVGQADVSTLTMQSDSTR